MTARYDKYDPISGGFRANLNAAITDTAKIGVPLAVGLNSSGKIVEGSGATGVVGVLVADQAKAAGEVVDVMTAGEIVDLDEDDFDPGALYFGGSTGVVDTTDTGVLVGFTVGDASLTTGTIRSRLVVRVKTADTIA
jgi:hypothetical protein